MQNQNCRTTEENTESIFDLRVGESFTNYYYRGTHTTEHPNKNRLHRRPI